MPCDQPPSEPSFSSMESKIARHLLVALSLTFVLLSVFSLSEASARHDEIRVAVLKEAKDFDLSIRGKFQIFDPKTNIEWGRGRLMPKSKITAAANGIKIDQQIYPVPQIEIRCQKDAAISFKEKSRRYRGRLDIVRDAQGALTVINTVDLENYVKGVLYHEVPRRWPLNAIKAQAVATRGYALYQKTTRKHQAYDVTSDIYSQVYGGRSAERYRNNIAADRTRGQVLAYNGELLPSYFHSTCGGRTEDAALLWKHDLPPLAGVVCGFCEHAPYSQWKKNFRSQDVQNLLNRNGFNLGLIKTIAVLERTPSGRAKTLQITTRDGYATIVSALKFRDLIGPNVLKSNMYDIEMKGYYFDVVGRGWGHGVGMCQWGAYFMARERYNYKSILTHYYPGAKLTKISEL